VFREYFHVKLCRAQAVLLLERTELLLVLPVGLVSTTKGRKLPFLLKRMIGTPFWSWSVVTLSPYTGPSGYTEIKNVLLSLWPGRRYIGPSQRL
jgi:hypothetical protein